MTTTLAMGGFTGFTTGLGSSTAGDIARKVTEMTMDALEKTKVGSSAGSTLVFNDLMALANECGADANSTPVFQMAQLFLLALPTHLLAPGMAPELARDGDGDIVFDWAGSGGRMFTVALNESGKVYYAARLSAWDKDHGTKRFVDTIPRPILELIQKVTAS